MKSYSLYGVLGLGVAALVAPAACTVTSTTINNTDDGGIVGDDTTLGTDTGSSSSGASSGGSETSTEASSSSSSSSGGDSGGDAGACPGAPEIVNIDGGAFPECNSCIQANCCAQIQACDSPDAGGGIVDDATATTLCEDKLGCAVGLLKLDAGTLTQNLATCFFDDASAAPASLTNLVSCAGTNCSTQCQ
jgi:hypothetical protein